MGVIFEGAVPGFKSALAHQRLKKVRKGFFFIAAAFLISGLGHVQAQERGQAHLRDLGQKQHDAGISQRPHESGLLQPELEEMKKPGPGARPRAGSASPPTMKDRLSRGWSFYRRGDYARAIPLFTQASNAPDAATAKDARLGLAYSFLKQGQRDKAKGLLEELAREDFKTGEVLSNLLPLFLADEDYPRAKPYLALLPEKERAPWEKKFQDAQVRSDYRKLAKPASAGDLKRLVKADREALENCVAQDVFAGMAKDLAAAGSKNEAAALYRDLLKCPESDWKARLGAVYGLAEAASPEEVESALAGEKKKGPADYRAEVSDLELSLLRKQLAAQPPGSPEAEKVSRKILALRPDDPSAQRALAWGYFNQGKNEEAYRLFTSLHARYPGERDYALGLAYTQMKMGKDGEALALAEKVPFRDEEWQKVLIELYLRRARAAFEAKEYAAAETWLNQALMNEPGNREARILLGWTLLAGGEEDRTLSLVRGERERGGLSPEHGKGLDDLELAALRKKMAALPPASPEIEALAGRILALRPGDSSARRALAWMHYNRGNDREAYPLFASLQRQYPDDRDFALGLIYTQMRMGKTDEALALAERSGFQDREWQEVRAQLYLRKAGEAYDRKRFEEARVFAGKTLALQPGNRDAELLTARSYSAQGKHREALPIYLGLYQKSPSPEAGKSVLSAYDQLGERKKAYSLAESLGQDSSPASKRAAAEYLAAHGAPVRAAQVNPEAGTCYFNADKPSVDGSFFFRYKSGSDGFDKLTEADFPFTLDYPAPRGRKWTFSLIPAHLSSGTAPAMPYAGNFFKQVNGGPKQNDLITSLWAVKPEVGFQQEGPVRYGFLLGTSFFGGAVSPLPTFTAGAAGRNWLVNVHQLQVDESLLSYAGQRDPYTDKRWGRVLRTGIDGEVNFEPRPAYWLSFAAGYDYLWGQDVWSNQAVFGNASFGKTIPWGPGDLSAGLFASAKHFQRNTNFFTYGHGGYFSPDFFFMTGPTVRYITAPCKTYSIDARASAGYMYYKTQDSPHYPLLDENLGALNGPARADASGSYSGETVSRLGFSGKVRGVKLFGNRWIGSAFLSFNNAASYNEWRTGVSLQYFFDTIRNAAEFRHFLLREPEDRFQRFSR